MRLILGHPPRGRSPHYNQRGRGRNVNQQEAWKARASGYPDYQSTGSEYPTVEPEWEANIPTSNYFFPLADREGPDVNFGHSGGNTHHSDTSGP